MKIHQNYHDYLSGGTSTTDPALISTPLLGATGPNCKLTFSYRHLYPSAPSPTLSIILYKRPEVFWPLSKTIRTITENTGWKNYTVDIGKLPAGYQIRISANGTLSIYTRPYLDVELDNIKFVDCDPSATVTPSSLSCDFESGTCGWFDWNMASTNKLDWVRIAFPCQ